MKMRKIATMLIAALLALSCVTGTAFAGKPDGSGLWRPESADWTAIERGEDVVASLDGSPVVAHRMPETAPVDRPRGGVNRHKRKRDQCGEQKT